MKKSLSLILAIALVFSMFVTPVFAEENGNGENGNGNGNGEEVVLDTAQKFEELKEAGIFQGHPGGEAALEENMTRAQAAVIMTELFQLDTSNPPATPSFSDVPASHWAYAYIEAAAKAGIINGRTNGEFDPGTVEEIAQGVGYVTLQELAIMLTLAFEQFYGLDIDPNGTVNGNVAPWAEAYVAAAIEQGLLPAGADYTVYASRGDLVDAAYEAYQYIKENPLPGKEPTVQGIKSFAAVGAKKLQLVMNLPLDEDDKISLKRNGRDAEVAKIETSSDKKEVTIVTAAKLREAEYTAVVKTADGAEYTATIEVEDERVENIEILSEYAPLDRELDNVVYAYIRVTNQYGEDVTKAEAGSLVMTASPGGRDGMAHEEGNKFSITADDDYQFRIGDRVTVSVVHPDSTRYATASLEVSAPSRVSSIEIYDLYHPDDEVPEAGSDDDQFHLLVNVFDQYGHEMTASDAKEDVLYTVDFRYVITVAEDADGKPNFVELNIDGEEHIGLQLAADDEDKGFQAGTATITLLSSLTGQRDSYTVTVEEESILDVFKMSQPDVAVAGDEEIKIPFEAYDQNGEEITKASKLKDKDKGVQSKSVSGAGLSEANLDFKQNPVTGKAELILDASGASNKDQNQRVIITIITQTGKVERLTLTLRSEAYPDGISKLDFPTVFAIGGSKELELKNVEIVDQYDRKVDMKDKVNAGDYRIVIESSDSDVISLNGGSKFTYNGNADDKVVVKGEDKGRATITVELFNDEGKSIDRRSFSFRVVEKADISDYKVEELAHPLRYFENEAAVIDDYKKEVKVKAYLSNGNEVVIPNSYYTVTSAVYSDGNKLYGVVPDKLNVGDDKEYTYTVVIYADGGNVQHTGKVTVLNEAPKPTKLSLKDDTKVNGYEAKKRSDGLVTVDRAAINSKADVEALVKGIIEVKDQFDVELKDVKLDVLVDRNIKWNELEEGDDFDVTVSARGATLTFTIGLE